MMKQILFSIVFIMSNQTFTNNHSHFNKVNNYLTSLAEQNKFSGSIFIAQQGNVVLSKGYGLACREFNISNTPETKFTIASITKPITAIAILQLYEKELLNLSDTVNKYVPDFCDGDKVTIHHLLSHSSGIPDIFIIPDILNKIKFPITVKDRISLFKNMSLEFTPGTQHQYSQPNYYLLTHIIELVSGMSYDEFVTQHIFIPAGMHNTGSHLNHEIIPNLASGYVQEQGAIRKPDYFDMSWAHGTGGLYSTVEDLYILDQALYTEKLLKHTTSLLMYNSHIPLDNSYYGYGWEISELHNKKYVAHVGKMFGFSSYLIRFIQDNTVIILLSNLEETLDETKNKITTIATMIL